MIDAMLFATPSSTKSVLARLKALDELREKLGKQDDSFGPWMGTLRREIKAMSVESSTSIEGFKVSHNDAIGVVEGREIEPGDRDRLAVACYARAMDHVGIMATDPSFNWSDRVVLDLHFDACYFQSDISPGHWRTGPVAVTTGTGGIAYRGPDGADIPKLMEEVVTWLEVGDPEVHPVVRAAMAHLHVVSVHPFRDGNGRISRIVQSLVLALERLVSPEFGSIEEYLAQNTHAYYSVLTKVQGGSYRPDRNASAWVDFCIDAHLAQAKQRLEQIEKAASRWAILESQSQSHGWPDRLVIALEQSLLGGSDRKGYRSEADVSMATASADFRRLIDAGLIEQLGKGRSTRYVASERLRKLVAENG